MSPDEFHVIACPCGVQVRTPITHTHGRVECPSCGRRHLVPARPNPLFRYHANPDAATDRSSDADSTRRRRRRSRRRLSREAVWLLLGTLLVVGACALTVWLINF